METATSPALAAHGRTKSRPFLKSSPILVRTDLKLMLFLRLLDGFKICCQFFVRFDGWQHHDHTLSEPGRLFAKEVHHGDSRGDHSRADTNGRMAARNQPQSADQQKRANAGKGQLKQETRPSPEKAFL